MARRPRRVGTGSSSDHTEWMSLIDVSGPFLSLPVLADAFPQGLEADDPDHAGELRLAYEEWRKETERGDETLQRTWVRYVLRETLGFTDEVRLENEVPEDCIVTIPVHHVTLRPDFVMLDPKGVDDRQPRLLVMVTAPGQNLERPSTDDGWRVSPASRMVELLRGAGERGVALGILTNGERWMVVHAPRDETVGYASWWGHLWFEERLTLRAFRSLFGARRFFGVEEEKRIGSLYARSAKDQYEVTDQLGLQVRIAVETLVRAIDKIDADGGRQLLQGFDEKDLYRAAVTVMMRLVFLLYAEERDLLPSGDPFYDVNYAVSTLHGQLREDADLHGEEILERRHSAWCRLLAISRVVYGGIDHEVLQFPALGGGLFDPDRFPFLEGRSLGTSWRETPADPLAIDDRIVLHLLSQLQFLSVRAAHGGGSEAHRLSFRALGVEQIGHVYESLLDHTAKRATGPVLGLLGKAGEEPEVPLEDLEEWRAEGEDALLENLKTVTGKRRDALGRALSSGIAGDDGRWLPACGGDGALLERVRPFAAVVRDDSQGQPIVIAAGGLYVTKGSDRRSTGTHYTPPTLTEPIVKHTLEPLVYAGPAEGTAQEEWKLRSPRGILGLKVCDMAVGSGAFLVQACRYLGERLMEAWEKIERANPGKVIVTPEGDLSTGSADERPIPNDPSERVAIARRAVADRCLYGVDKDPMAVDMAKLSIWLITLQKNRPFEFLDHAIKHGDSLLGLQSFEQLKSFHVDPDRGRQLFGTEDFFDDAVSTIDRMSEEATEKRNELERIQVIDVRDTEMKAALDREAENAVEALRSVGDVIIGAAIANAQSENAVDAATIEFQPLVARAFDSDVTENDRRESFNELSAKARDLLGAGNPNSERRRRCFHWPIEFPEVFSGENPGFDAIVGNPPFQGGQKITGEHGTDYRNYLVEFIADGRRGSADLCAYFFLRAVELLRENGGFGLLATNTIAQGDTREVGLSAMVESDIVLTRAVPSRKWPGVANLEVAHVWGRRGEWNDGYVINDQPVDGITAHLSRPGRVTGDPYRLEANKDKSFIGSYVLGMGFVMTPDEAKRLIAKDPKNEDVLFPYLNGEDLNSRPDQSPSRWVINFFDWPLDRSAEGSWENAEAEERTEWLRDGRVPADYPDPVAADYPDCLRIIEEKVKPERQNLRDDGGTQSRRKRLWWRYASDAKSLYSAIRGMRQVMAIALTSKTLSPVIVSSNRVFDQTAIVFALSGHDMWAVLAGSFHYLWALKYGAELTRIIHDAA